MRRRTEVMVGATVIAGIALVVIGTIWLQGRGFGREEASVFARFGEVGHLLEGNAVKLRGVPIGRVDRVALDADGSGVLVEMRISSEVRLPEDPVVLLAPESMFGDWQAEIYPRSSFPLYDYTESPDPAVLPGYTLPDISRLTAVADRIAQNMATLSERFEIAFTEETAANIANAIDNIEEVTGRLTALVATQGDAIDRLAADLSRTAGILEEAVVSVRQTLGEIDQAVDADQLAAIVDNVARASARTEELTDELLQMSRNLGAAAVSADSTLERMAAVAGAIESGEGTLGQLVRDPDLYLRMVESTIAIEALLRDIRENPRRYITVRIF